MEEIKAEDIMLGNWFRGYDGEPFQWNLAHFGLLTLDGPTVDEIIMAPIPLTEDILSKSGFSMRWGTDPQEPNALKVYYIDDFELFKFEDKDMIFYIDAIGLQLDILTVHQLQNLFKSLTGNDLNIKL